MTVKLESGILIDCVLNDTTVKCTYMDGTTYSFENEPQRDTYLKSQKILSRNETTAYVECTLMNGDKYKAFVYVVNGEKLRITHWLEHEEIDIVRQFVERDGADMTGITL